MFSCYSVLLLMRDRKGVDLEVRGAGEELGREKGEETVISAWCINE